jgi:hypothetical protein
MRVMIRVFDVIFVVLVVVVIIALDWVLSVNDNL